MKRSKIALCACPTCQQMDRVFPHAGRQIAMFAAPKTDTSRSRNPKGAN
ncbi:hypothetical protein [Sphingobium sp.]|nr:hypothetical protein [Sphingobium sp.]